MYHRILNVLVPSLLLVVATRCDVDARPAPSSALVAGVAGFDTNIVFQTHNNGYLRTTATNYGYFGTVRNRLHDSTGALVPVMESPVNSGIEYLYEAGLWIGGVVGGDTLVSTGSLGFGIAHELYADGYEPGVRSDFLGDDEWTFVYGDTTTDPETVRDDPYDGPHRSLPVRVRQKTYTFDAEAANSAIFIELVVSNIGLEPISDVWIGWLMDPDIGHINRQNYWADDLTGHSRQTLNTADGSIGASFAWALDNDGDPNIEAQYTGKSAKRVFGSMYLGGNTSLDLESYNWWVPSLRKEFDWGPQRFPGDTNRFGGRGFEATDRFRYRLMSNKELDYAQPYAAVNFTAEGWMPPASDSIAIDFASGFDIRFLHTVGAVNLAPGDSTVVHWVWCIADNPFRRSDNFRQSFDPRKPDAFVYGLGLDALGSQIGRLKQAWMEGFRNVPVSAPKNFRISQWDDTSGTMVWTPKSTLRIKGYQIIRSRAPLLSVPDETFWLPVSSATFVDSELEQLQGYEYTMSCVGGSNQFGGIVAEASARISLLPDRTSSPGKPEVRPTESSITVWASESDDPRIVAYRVLRSASGAQFAEIGAFARGHQLIDSTITAKVVYQFALIGISRLGTKSEIGPSTFCAGLDLNGPPLILDFTARGAASLTDKDSVMSAWLSLIAGAEYVDGSMRASISLDDFERHPITVIVSDDRAAIPAGVDHVVELYSLSGGSTLISGRDLFNHSLVHEQSIPLSRGSIGWTAGIRAAYYPRTLLANPTRMNAEFVGGTQRFGDLPHLDVDSTRTAWGLNPVMPHPGNAIPFVGYFDVDTSVAEVLYTFESRDGSASPLHGKPVAVMSKQPGRTLAVFAFPLTYIEESDARACLAAVLARMGHGSTMAAGDADNDGVVTAADAVTVINYLYRDGYLINDRNADVNGDCRVDVLDVVFLSDHVYHGAQLTILHRPQ